MAIAIGIPDSAGDRLAAMLLKERIEWALDPKRGPRSQAGLARACGIKAPSVNDWLTGKTKAIASENLFDAARYLGVRAEWLATDKEPRLPSGESDPEAQSLILDPAMLAEAEKWVMFEEGAGYKFSPNARAERLIQLYRMVVEDGGSLSPDHADIVIQQSRARVAAQAGGNASRRKGGSRK